MKNKQQLKFCPFCKNRGFDRELLSCISIEPYLNDYGYYDGYEISCQNVFCPFQPSGWFETKEDAIAFWNSRV